MNEIKKRDDHVSGVSRDGDVWIEFRGVQKLGGGREIKKQERTRHKVQILDVEARQTVA